MERTHLTCEQLPLSMRSRYKGTNIIEVRLDIIDGNSGRKWNDSSNREDNIHLR